MKYEEAEKLFFEELSRLADYMPDPNPPKIISVTNYPWGWIFYYDSKAYLEDGEDLMAYLPAVPILIDKIDGTVEFISIGHPFFDTGNLISDYEKSKGYDKLMK